MDAMTWIILGLASAASYGGLILAGRWVFELGYRGK